MIRKGGMSKHIHIRMHVQRWKETPVVKQAVSTHIHTTKSRTQHIFGGEMSAYAGYH